MISIGCFYFLICFSKKNRTGSLTIIYFTNSCKINITPVWCNETMPLNW